MRAGGFESSVASSSFMSSASSNSAGVSVIARPRVSLHRASRERATRERRVAYRFEPAQQIGMAYSSSTGGRPAASGRYADLPDSRAACRTASRSVRVTSTPVLRA
jgi:hypothetical protein